MKRFLALATLLAIICSFTLTSCTNPPIEPGPSQSESQPENVTQNNTATVINVTGDQVKDLISQMQNAFMVDTNMNTQEVKDAEVIE